MAQSQLMELTPTVASPSAWAANRPKEKGPDYYKSLNEQLEMFISGNEPLLVLSLLKLVNIRTISLLTMYIKTWKLISINRNIMEEALKCLNIWAKILARRRNAM